MINRTLHFSLRAYLAFGLQAFLFCGLFNVKASADGITLAETYAGKLDGTTAVGATYGAVNGSASNANSGSSSSADYFQSWSTYASASAGVLHAAASETINCAACAPLLIPGSGGAADVGAGALAWFDDVITVIPGSSVVSLNFVFSVDGITCTTSSTSPYASIEMESCAIGSGFCYAGITRNHTITDLPLNGTNTVSVNITPWALNTPINIEAILGIELDPSVTYDSTGTLTYLQGPSSGSVDFSDTAQLTAIQAVDAHGNIVNDGTIILDDNDNALPDTTPVPEPASLTLLVTGGLLTGLGFGFSDLRRRI